MGQKKLEDMALNQECTPEERGRPALISRSNLFKVLGLIGAMAVPTDSCFDPNLSENGRNRSDSKVVSGSEVKKFDPGTYKPPKEGRIWKRKITDSEKQTVIYVPDIHSTDGDPKSWVIQKEIFAIVEDGIKKYGQVPVVLEAWTDYGKGDFYNFRQYIHGDMLENFIAESDLTKRRDMAVSLMSAGKSGAPRLLPAVYLDELIPVPSHDSEQLLESTAVATQFFSVGNFISENAPCADFDTDVKMGVRDVIDSPKKSKEAIDCFCTFDALFRFSSDAFNQNRSFDSPREEVRRANAYNGRFVYIITGTGHASETINQLEAKGVNYIVVAPRSNNMTSTSLESFPPPAPYCEKWAKTHQKHLSSTIANYTGAFRDRARMILSETEVGASDDPL